MANKSNFRAGRNQDALSENVELLTGQRGDGLDRAITLRELNELGLAGLSRIGGIYTSKTGITAGTTKAGAVDFPAKPLNVVASGAFNTILITWDEPNYRGHSYAEIWRAETDNLAVAVNIGSCTANVYADAIGGDAHVYYWVRFVNRNNVPGPYNATAGTYAETGVDITQLLASLTNQITSDQLTQELLTPINSVPGIAADVQVNASAIAAANATYSAQWSVKTTVGALNGGFGIFNDGATTRFTVVTNRFAIVDASLGNTPFVPFVVDSGRVIIDTAFIKQAWIESLAAAQVTADKIATLSLYSVTITGGSLALGSGNASSYMQGGSAGFGKGGPYSGWGYSWHTIIYNSGAIYTDSLHASAGSFTGTVNANAGTFNNVTINENCNVKGTIYANKIVGDVVAIKAFNLSFYSAGNTYKLNKYTRVNMFSFVLAPSTINRLIKITGSSINSSVGGANMELVIGGTQVASSNTSVNGLYDVPSSTSNTTILFRAYATGTSDYSYVWGLLTGEVTVYPVSSGTFV